MPRRDTYLEKKEDKKFSKSDPPRSGTSPTKDDHSRSRKSPANEEKQTTHKRSPAKDEQQINRLSPIRSEQKTNLSPVELEKKLETTHMSPVKADTKPVCEEATSTKPFCEEAGPTTIADVPESRKRKSEQEVQHMRDTEQIVEEAKQENQLSKTLPVVSSQTAKESVKTSDHHKQEEPERPKKHARIMFDLPDDENKKVEPFVKRKPKEVGVHIKLDEWKKEGVNGSADKRRQEELRAKAEKSERLLQQKKRQALFQEKRRKQNKTPSRMNKENSSASTHSPRRTAPTASLTMMTTTSSRFDSMTRPKKRNFPKRDKRKSGSERNIVVEHPRFPFQHERKRSYGQSRPSPPHGSLAARIVNDVLKGLES